MINKKLLLIMLMTMSTSLTYAQATCSTIDCIALALIPQVTGLADALMVLSYIFGLIFGYKAILKLKDWSESKGQQTKLSAPIVMLIAAVCFICLPTFLNIGVETMSLNKSSSNNLGNY